MKKTVWLTATMVVFSWLPMWGQETSFPKGEIFATYSYFNIDGGGTIPRQSLNGWGAGYNPNFNSFLGATVQVLGAYGIFGESFVMQRTGVEVVSADIAAHGFLGGPEVSYRGPTFRVFAHGLAGAVNYTLKNLSIRSGDQIIAMLELRDTETNFGWGAGVGLDRRIAPGLAARIFQFDYIVEKSDPIRRHYRMAFGLVGRFGGGE